MDKYVNAVKMKNVTSVLKFKDKVEKSLYIKATNSALSWSEIGVRLIILSQMFLTRKYLDSIYNQKAPIDRKNVILKQFFLRIRLSD